MTYKCGARTDAPAFLISSEGGDKWTCHSSSLAGASVRVSVSCSIVLDKVPIQLVNTCHCTNLNPCNARTVPTLCPLCAFAAASLRMHPDEVSLQLVHAIALTWTLVVTAPCPLLCACSASAYTQLRQRQDCFRTKYPYISIGCDGGDAYDVSRTDDIVSKP